MMTLLQRALAGLGVAALGCSSTTAIRPDQLPVLTDAAARGVQTQVDVIGVSGGTVHVDGTLVRVSVLLRAGPEAVRTYRAPVVSEMSGGSLFVRDKETNEPLPLPWIDRVNVT